jgi:hypothetical protein
MEKNNTQLNAGDMPKDPFAYIAFWQLLTFIILIMLVWLNELQDGAAVFFHNTPDKFNIFRACTLTAAVLIAAIITIGNTYLQQRRVLKSLIAVCSNCHRVRINDEVWQKLEEYIGERSLLTFSHGLCPDCTKELMKTIEKK